jgi:hypothetical protein
LGFNILFICYRTGDKKVITFVSLPFHKEQKKFPKVSPCPVPSKIFTPFSEKAELLPFSTPKHLLANTNKSGKNKLDLKKNIHIKQFPLTRL